jgi:hypothetical protein
MLRKLKEKAGNEILQTLVIVAVIGALAITICVLVSNKFKDTAKDSTNTIGQGLSNSINGAMSIDQDGSIGTGGTY